MGFDYLENTEITIDNKKHMIRFENGMTGIGSRLYWIDDKKCCRALVSSPDITNGNHEIYKIRWRDNPWSTVHAILCESEVKNLFEPHNAWRMPIKITCN